MVIMYNSKISKNALICVENLEKKDKLEKLEFLIYLFERIINGQINRENILNPTLNNDEDSVEIFSLDELMGEYNFSYNFLNNLVDEYNKLEGIVDKIYLDNGAVYGMNFKDGEQISLFESLEYLDKLAVIAELIIKIDNGTLFDENIYLDLGVNGFDLANKILN